MKLKLILILLASMTVVLLSSCANLRQFQLERERKPLFKKLTPSEIERVMFYEDSGKFEGLSLAIKNQLQLSQSNKPLDIRFENWMIPYSIYERSLQKLADILDNPELTYYEKKKYIFDTFDFYETYGEKADENSVFFTSYYEPLLFGSRQKTKDFSQPLYERPLDMVELQISNFLPQLTNERALRGRLEKNADRLKLVPYWSRLEIDRDRKMNAKIICYVNPIDAFFLHIQGSGQIQLVEQENVNKKLKNKKMGTKHTDAQEEVNRGETKKIFVNYSDKNGQPYRSIGKIILETKPQIVPPEGITLGWLENYLKNLSEDERMQLMAENQSYVFFKESEQSALTSLGVSAVDGRTIATDSKIYPKGALAWIYFDAPQFNERTVVSHFVMDQDIGGAIRGSGRVDFFWGRGNDAKNKAGQIKNYGRLFYLAPKM